MTENNPVKVFIGGDTGPSGFGVATKGLVRHLLQQDGFKVTLHSHHWGWNREGHQFDADLNFGDERFKHFLISNGYLNPDYMDDTVRDVVDRNKESEEDLTDDLKHNRKVDSEDCMVRQFEGKEDVWIGIGGQNFAEHAPDDEDIYKILSTDFNLSLVPRDWQHYLSQVDEVWVPSEWTYNAIKNRFQENYPEIVDKTEWFHYGINMNYKPTDYDCEACPGPAHQTRNPAKGHCLKDGKFNFLVVSRFYHIKGVYRTIRAFVKEFRGDESVRLFFKTTSNQQFEFSAGQSVQKIIKEIGYPDPPEIGVKQTSFDSQHMYDLFGHADAFIQASRAECFGIAQLQAAYCGTPVIYTNWSSQAEVCDEDNKGFIPLNEFEVEKPEGECPGVMYAGSDDYPPDSEWASPSEEALGDRMREVFEMSKDERDDAGREAKKYVEDNFDWSEKIKPRVERIKRGAENVR